MLVQLIDGGIVDIVTDTWSSGGCETCDWGSSYVNELTVVLTETVIVVEVSQMYDYPLSDGYLMKLFLANLEYLKTLTVEEFTDWLRQELTAEAGDLESFEVRGRF